MNDERFVALIIAYGMLLVVIIAAFIHLTSAP